MHRALFFLPLAACAPASFDTSDTAVPGDTADVDTEVEPDTEGPFDALAWSDSAQAATGWEDAQPFDTLRDDLPLEAFAAVSQGRELFMADWVATSTTASPVDGLGPYFHARSCVACHPAVGRPVSLSADGTVAAGLLLRLRHTDDAGPDAHYGDQLQPLAIGGLALEMSVRWSRVADTPLQLADGSQIERHRVQLALTPGQGPVGDNMAVVARLSPQLVGGALLDAVATADLVALEDPDDLDGDGISGRLARLGTGTDWQAGRFGWKASQASLRTQTAAAFAEDMGITSPLHPTSSCTASQTDCLALASDTLDLPDSGLDQVTAYLDALTVPARRPSGDPRDGEGLFAAVGCADCHLPELYTADDAEPAHTAGLRIRPYTDLLLHDMGEELADGAGEADASAAEWRTPPLWGLGRVMEQPQARYLHDGRAATVSEAIAWHGGEALAARDAFAALSSEDRAALLAFLAML